MAGSRRIPEGKEYPAILHPQDVRGFSTGNSMVRSRWAAAGRKCSSARERAVARIFFLGIGQEILGDSPQQPPF